MKRQRSHDADQHRGASRRWPVRRKVVALVLGALVAVSAMLTAGVTTAAFTDTEWASVGQGIATGTHDLQFSGAGSGGPWSQAPEETPVEIKLASDAPLVPGGGPVSGTAWVKNSGDYYSSLDVKVVATEAVAGSLTWTADDGSGAVTPVDGVATLGPVAPGGVVTVTFTFTLGALEGTPPASVDLAATFTGTSIPNPGGM